MTKAEKRNWLTNLEDVSSQIDAETVKFICGEGTEQKISTDYPLPTIRKHGMNYLIVPETQTTDKQLS